MNNNAGFRRAGKDGKTCLIRQSVGRPNIDLLCRNQAGKLSQDLRRGNQRLYLTLIMAEK